MLVVTRLVGVRISNHYNPCLIWYSGIRKLRCGVEVGW